MQTKIGSIIEPPSGDNKPDGGIPAISLDTGGTGKIEQQTGDSGIEPEIIAGYESAEPDTLRINAAEPRRRGRPRGSGSGRGSTAGIGSAQKETPNSLVDLTTLLLSIHQMGSSLLDIEELSLDKTEAVAMSDAIKEVARFYPTSIDPKKLAIVNLAAVMGGIYGTRIMAYRARMKKEHGDKLVPINAKKQAPKSQVNGAAQPTLPHELWNEPPIESTTGF